MEGISKRKEGVGMVLKARGLESVEPTCGLFGWIVAALVIVVGGIFGSCIMGWWNFSIYDFTICTGG